MFKSVTIMIPVTIDENLLSKAEENINKFLGEKVLLAINIGCKCIADAEQSMLGFTEEMIYNKVKDETIDELKRLEMDLLIEKETAKKMDEKTTNKYEIQMDRYKKQIDALMCQLRTYESENKDVINEAVKKEKDKYDLLLDAKEKRIDKLQDTNDQIKEALIKLTHKSTAHKGSEGENEFKVYAD